jgi:hypothetical protein
VTAAPIVAQAAAFGGTLMGDYSNVNVPGFSHILNYATSGTLSGEGGGFAAPCLVPDRFTPQTSEG